MADTMQDWQILCKNLKERGKRLLQSSHWADCTFLVGNEPNQLSIKGHRLFLAMASPVFEAMFYGGIPERNDPILILDVQPEAFKSLLEYIYSDEININSFDKACELCYAAKKYMLPHLVQECTNYLWSDLNAKNACRAYEFAKLFEEPTLMEKCLQIICTQTLEVLSESSFEEIELSTLIKIFEQDNLNINSELELFNAALKYANAHANNSNCANVQRQANRSGSVHQPLQSNESPSSSENHDESVQNNQEKVCPGSEPSTSNSYCKIIIESVPQPGSLTIRNAIQKIRFLTLSPQEFAEGPARSDLLSQSEAFAILMNISSPRSEFSMPEGFTSSTQCRIKAISIRQSSIPSGSNQKRHLPMESLQDPLDVYLTSNNETNKYYCHRSIDHETDCMNASDLECSVTFTVDRNICVIGVRIPTQVLGEHKYIVFPTAEVTYSELLYAHLLDADGSRLTYTHYTSRVVYNNVIDIIFNRPFYIQRNKVYKVAVVMNKLGWYPIGESVSERVICDNVCFSFGVGPRSDSVRDGLIRAIIFTY